MTLSPPDPTPVSDSIVEFLNTLEPDDVQGYTVAFGHAFDGIRLEGLFPSFEDALIYAENHSLHEDWKVVPVWKENS